MRDSLVLTLIPALIPTSSVAAATVQVFETHELLASDRDSHDSFGMSVSAMGTRAVVGAADDDDPTLGGSAYVFECDATGTWQEITKLVHVPGTNNDWFGASVSLFGDRVLIGAPMDDHPFNSGAAYVFERQPGGAWIEVAKLKASDADTTDFFGMRVSLFEDRAIVGSPQAKPGGAAYVFERSAEGSWVETARIEELIHGFGRSVSLWGSLAAVGSELDIVVLYRRETNGSWVEETRFSGLGDGLGYAVALAGDRLILGAFRSDHSGLVQAGSAFLLERDSAGAWSSPVTLTASDAGAYHHFGTSVAVSGDRAVVSAPYSNLQGEFSGEAYLFERQPDGAWAEVARLGTSHDPALLGDSTALSGDSLFVGSALHAHSAVPACGAVFVYDAGPGSTYCESTPNSTGAPAVLSAFGSASVAANDLSLHASPVPKVASGIFFFGPSQVDQPFGNGVRCVGGSIVRLSPQGAADHVLEQRLDLAAPPLAGSLVAGSTWHVQAWYRDVPAGGAYFNTSSALSILFEN